MQRRQNSYRLIGREQVKRSPAPAGPPPGSLLVREARALFDVASVPFSLAASAIKTSKTKQASWPVILFPGFASDQRYLKPLQRFLRQQGIRAEDWGLGVNLAGMNLSHALEDLSAGWDVETYEGYSAETYRGEAGVPYLCDVAAEQVRKRSRELGSPVILVGWSLGGYVAREVARDLPEEVAQVVTMGSPVVGGPKYTRAAKLFAKKGFDLDWIESESGKRDSRPITQPITAIFSKSDGVVDWTAALDRVSPNVEHLEVNVPHLGMGFNKTVWRLVAGAIEQQAKLRQNTFANID